MYPATIRCVRLGFGLLALGALFLSSSSSGAEAKTEGPVVKMAAFEVTAFSASVKVRPTFRDTSKVPRLLVLTVEEVRANSVAERAGLKRGMTILEFDGKEVVGMTEQEFDLLWRGPFWNSLTMRVAVSRWFGGTHSQEIHLPLPMAPVMTFQLFPAPPAENAAVPPQE